MLENFAEIVNSAEAGRLGTDEGTAEAEALAGENAVLIRAADLLVLTEEETDLTAANADVACGNVNVRSDVALELGHEALAEAHDLSIGLAVGIEIGAALTAAHGEGSEAVLEGLLEAEELHNGEIYVGCEAETSLVGADRAVELYAEATVYLNLTVAIHPGYAEFDNALRLYETLEKTVLFVFGMLFNHGLEGTKNLFNGLDEFRLMRIACANLLDDSFDVGVHLKILQVKYNDFSAVKRLVGKPYCGITNLISMINPCGGKVNSYLKIYLNNNGFLPF
jgi:hypothetical protein